MYLKLLIHRRFESIVILGIVCLCTTAVTIQRYDFIQTDIYVLVPKASFKDIQYHL